MQHSPFIKLLCIALAIVAVCGALVTIVTNALCRLALFYTAYCKKVPLREPDFSEMDEQPS